MCNASNMFHEAKSVKELLGNVVGAASVAWHPNDDGKIFAEDVIFNDVFARKVVDQAEERLSELGY